MLQPLASGSKTRETQIRCPLMQGLPKQTLGSIEIRCSNSSRVIFFSLPPLPRAISKQPMRNGIAFILFALFKDALWPVAHCGLGPVVVLIREFLPGLSGIDLAPGGH